MTNQQKDILAAFAYDIMQRFEPDFEDTIEKHGSESDQARDHVYTKARDLFAEFELDYREKA